MDDYNHFDAAWEDLAHTHDELNDGALYQALKKHVHVPDTGNHAADYKNVRAQLENLINHQA